MDKQELLRQYPPVLKADKQFSALGVAIAEQLEKNRALADSAIIYAATDSLSEEILDALAYDFKVDWYEYSAPIENKRKVIKECLLVHKYKGTKYAVETALHSIFTDAKVEEWFEYGGEPYHFKLTVYGGTSGGNLKNLYAKIQYAKNLRSVMDDTVFVIIPAKPADIFVGGKMTAQSKTIGATVKFTGETVSTRTAPIHIAATSYAKTKRIHAVIHYDHDEDPP